LPVSEHNYASQYIEESELY